MLEAITIIDVAREAGVSYATVSRVINNKQHVRPDTRERVQRAMTKLGYVVNQQARSLAGGDSRVIGLLVHDLGTSYIGEIIRGVDTELARAQYDLMLYTTHRRKTRETAFVASLSRGLADGLLLVLPRNAEAYLDSLRLRQVPYVLIDHQGFDNTGPSVVATNERGAYDATSYLIRVGHRRIGFITGALDLPCARDRQAGYRRALQEHGLPHDPGLIQEGNFFQPQGFSAAYRLLEQPAAPTAIFASNDVTAFGAMEAAHEFRRRIPEDLSIVGFDDIPQAAQVHPLLSTVRQPLEEMGRLATRMLLEILDGQPHRARVELSTELVIRQSSGPPPG
jgi:LacI family transcriptional regulator